MAGRYLQCWELDAAIDVLTMCSCHLSVEDPLHLEVVDQPHSRSLLHDVEVHSNNG